MKKLTAVLFFAFAFLLSACGSGAQTQEAPTPTVETVCEETISWDRGEENIEEIDVDIPSGETGWENYWTPSGDWNLKYECQDGHLRILSDLPQYDLWPKESTLQCGNTTFILKGATLGSVECQEPGVATITTSDGLAFQLTWTMRWDEQAQSVNLDFHFQGHFVLDDGTWYRDLKEDEIRCVQTDPDSNRPLGNLPNWGSFTQVNQGWDYAAWCASDYVAVKMVTFFQ